MSNTTANPHIRMPCKFCGDLLVRLNDGSKICPSCRYHYSILADMRVPSMLAHKVVFQPYPVRWRLGDEMNPYLKAAYRRMEDGPGLSVGVHNETN